MRELSYEERFLAACSYAQSMHDEKCIAICNELIEENPIDGRVYAVMGEAALNMREHKAGFNALKIARVLSPENPYIPIRQADALVNLGNPRRAIKVLNSIRSNFIGTKDAPLWAQGMGDACRASGDYKRASQLLHYAIQEVPNWSVPWGSMAILEICKHNYSAGVRLFEKQYELKPNWKSAHELGMNLPFVGRWKEAYDYWHKAGDWKWQGGQFLGKRMWDGRKCGSLMVYGDGGLGDTIQYSRYLMEAKKHCEHVYFNPQKRHREIVEALELSGVEISTSHECDFATWLMILPGEVRLYSPEQSPPPTRINCPSIEMPHPAIAITWAGDFKHANDKLRSVKLNDFRSLIETYPHFHWFTVSPGKEIAAEIKSSGLPVTQSQGTLFEACCKLASADAYVGVDTGHAHVIATQNKPTHVIFKEFVDSRWGAEKDTTGYYSCARLYRSYRDGWDNCLKRIAGRLHETYHQSPQGNP